jgi:flagellar basal-body rod protein FlgB
MFGELVNSGATAALESVIRFAGGRQRIIAHNIANLTTPGFQSVDVSVGAFQAQLRAAIEQRRAEGGTAELKLGASDEVEVGDDGSMRLTPRSGGDGVLMHDRNNRNLERSMQDLVENATAFRVAADLLRARQQLLNAAISERA